MLYYILYPVIVIISFSVLMVFLFKKFSNSDRIDPGVVETLNGNGNGVWKKISSFFSHLWLRILEKLMQRTKLFSLKLHNASNNVFHSIKSKREMKNRDLEELEKDENERPEEKAEAFKKVVDMSRKPIESVEKRGSFFSMKKSSMEKISSVGGFYKRNKDVNKETEEKKIVEKAGLEEEFIKRIAINPKDVEAYERLGDYYSDINNFRDSVECYKQVLKLSPNNGSARSKMKNLELLLKK